MRVNQHTFTLASGEAHRFATDKMRFFRGLAGDDVYQIKLDNVADFPFQTGLAFKAPEFFDYMTVINTSAATQTITIVVSDGELQDNRLVGQIDITGGIRLAGNSGAAHATISLVDSATKSIIAANTSRGSLTLYNAGTGTMHINTTGIDIYNTGLPIGPGGSLVITSQLEIFGRVFTGGANSDCISWEETL